MVLGSHHYSLLLRKAQIKELLFRNVPMQRCCFKRTNYSSRRKDKKAQALDLLSYANETGFHILVAMQNIDNGGEFYHEPRIDFSILEKHAEGLIALSVA